MQQFLKFYYLTFYARLNMFRASSRPSSGATTAVAASGLLLVLGDSSAVGHGQAGPTTTNRTATITLQR